MIASRSSRSEEHTSELQSHSEISYAVFCLKKKKKREAISDHTIPDVIQITDKELMLIGKKQGRTTLIVWECMFFFFNATATTEIYTNLNTLSLHDALPISCVRWPSGSSPSPSAVTWLLDA